MSRCQPITELVSYEWNSVIGWDLLTVHLWSTPLALFMRKLLSIWFPQDPVSFGKLIRSVFLGLRTHPIGTRGNSECNYYGIRVKPNSALVGVEEGSPPPRTSQVKKKPCSRTQGTVKQQQQQEQQVRLFSFSSLSSFSFSSLSSPSSLSFSSFSPFFSYSY